MKNSKKILIITHTDVRKDPRISKHLKYFRENGWSVDFLDGRERLGFLYQILYVFNLIFRDIVGAFRARFSKFISRMKHRKTPDVILVNDWPTLPIAFALKQRYSAKLIYDTHEWAQEEHLPGIRQRFSVIPGAEKVEKTFINSADAVFTVNDSIKKKIHDYYGLDSEVVKNCADYSQLDFSAKNIQFPIKLYYHGLYLKMRCMEIFAEAVSQLPEKFELYFRLVGKIDRFKEFCSYAKNIFFVEPVPLSELVNVSSNYDIGISYIFPSNYNNWISLPNKFFEYIMAGLPVISGPSPEIRKIIEKYDIGFVSNGFSKESIVTALQSIEIKQVIKARKNVIKARKELRADIEWKKILNISEGL